jgi:excisionase family DNA binding protein
MDNALLTCLEAARFLNVRPATIRAWTSTRKISSIRIGTRAVRYRRGDLERLLKAGLRPALRPLHAPEDPREDGEGVER